jgi:hypothetical protein
MRILFLTLLVFLDQGISYGSYFLENPKDRKTFLKAYEALTIVDFVSDPFYLRSFGLTSSELQLLFSDELGFVNSKVQEISEDYRTFWLSRTESEIGYILFSLEQLNSYFERHTPEEYKTFVMGLYNENPITARLSSQQEELSSHVAYSRHSGMFSFDSRLPDLLDAFTKGKVSVCFDDKGKVSLTSDGKEISFQGEVYNKHLLLADAYYYYNGWLLKNKANSPIDISQWLERIKANLCEIKTKVPEETLSSDYFKSPDISTTTYCMLKAAKQLDKLSDEDFLKKVITLEKIAHSRNFFTIYRGTNGIEEGSQLYLDKLVGKPGDGDKEEGCFNGLSYGWSLFAGAVHDDGAQFFTYYLKCKYAYALMIPRDKLVSDSYLSRVFYLPPKPLLLSYVSYSEDFHPRAREIFLLAGEGEYKFQKEILNSSYCHLLKGDPSLFTSPGKHEDKFYSHESPIELLSFRDMLPKEKGVTIMKENLKARLLPYTLAYGNFGPAIKLIVSSSKI